MATLSIARTSTRCLTSRAPITPPRTISLLRPLRASNNPSLVLRRHIQQSAPFQPLKPPSPAELGAPRKARAFKKTTRWGRRILILTAVGGTLYLLDRQLYASGVLRSLRVFGLGLPPLVDLSLARPVSSR